MAENILTVVISQGQSRNPEKRQLEQLMADEAAKLAGTNCIVIPNLYDIRSDGESLKRLREVQGDMLVFSWLYERAAHWVLDRNGVRGQVGEVLLKRPDDEPEDEVEEDQEEEAVDEKQRVAQLHPRPSRSIYCVDLRVTENSADYLQELARIHRSCVERSVQQIPALMQWLSGSANTDALARFYQPTNDTSLGESAPASVQSLFGTKPVEVVNEHPGRRWYPVIDFSRCTNCMECIDFCLFGVYGVDNIETIVVEQPDNCRKGCPACSRVCPENAIIFPQHKTPAIAGAQVEAGGLKIDLSKLFGAPESDEDAVAVAARERDEQLLLAGRQAVGFTVGIREKGNAVVDADRPKDELDSLIDKLDELDL